MSTDVIMPQMGESIAEGTITKWLKKPGDAVKRDEPLFEISTDKVDAEIPSPAAGVLSEILVKEGQTVEINTVVGRIGAAGEKAAAAPSAAGTAAPTARAGTKSEPAAQQAQGKAAAPPAQQAQTRQASAPAEAQPQPSASAGSGAARPHHDAGDGDGDGDVARGGASREELRRTRSSPLVRKIASEHGVNISALQGTGISGASPRTTSSLSSSRGARQRTRPERSPRRRRLPVRRPPPRRVSRRPRRGSLPARTRASSR